MKKTIRVKTHFRKTKKGPRAIRAHSRSIKRAKMAEWSSEAERENLKTRRELLSEIRDAYPGNNETKYFQQGFEHALEMSKLRNKEGELKPFKRSKMAKWEDEIEPKDIEKKMKERGGPYRKGYEDALLDLRLAEIKKREDDVEEFIIKPFKK